MTQIDLPNHISCDFCKSNQFKHLLKRKDRLVCTTDSFHYLCCKQCGLVSLYPKPSTEELAQYYPEAYDSYVTGESSLDRLSSLFYQRAFDAKYRAISREITKQGELLDIGCATGQFLNHMSQRGWKVSGVEPNFQAAAYARKNYDLNVFAGQLEEANFSNCYYDVVTLWDVLEHLTDPLASLFEINRIMKKGGVLVLTVPNLESFDAYIFKKYWIGWDVPRHLYLFTLEVLEKYLSQAGFKFKNAYCLGGEYGAFILSLQTYWQGQTNLKYTSQLNNWVLFPLLRIFLLPYFWTARWFNKGPVTTVFCIKERNIPNAP